MFETAAIFIFGLALGLGAGVAAAYLWLRPQLQQPEQLRLNLRDSFAAIAAETLQNNAAQFLDAAKRQQQSEQEKAAQELATRQEAVAAMLAPLREQLAQLTQQQHGAEKDRIAAYSSMSEQINLLREQQQNLKHETGALVKALRAPQVRGRWGEIHLRRVVELAGMIQHVDFTEQVNVQDEQGRLRPDMVIHLPGGQTLVVDAKTPLDAYLSAHEAVDDTARAAFLRQHVSQIKTHISQLSAKNYWAQFSNSPEFVVLFLPGEAFLAVALEQEPTLLEKAMEERVIVATPTTLIALLRSAHYGWRQEKIAENARRISEAGSELYERISTLAENWSKLGASLGKSVEAFNKATASLETRVLPSARRMHEYLGRNSEPVKALASEDATPRLLSAPEMTNPAENATNTDKSQI